MILSVVSLAILLLLLVGWLALRWLFVQLARLKGTDHRLATRYFNYVSVTLTVALLFYCALAMCFATYYWSLGEKHFDCKPPCSSLSDYAYFSFVTMATVGYGDVTPKSSHGRNAVTAQIVVNILFIAVYMGLLISIGPLYAIELASRIQSVITSMRAVPRDPTEG